VSYRTPSSSLSSRPMDLAFLDTGQTGTMITTVVTRTQNACYVKSSGGVGSGFEIEQKV